MASSGKFSDLVEYVDWSSVECLNQKPGQEIGNALKQDHRDDDSLFLESDTDEQLLIFVPFNQNVKLGELVLKSTEKASGPLKVKVFVNRHSMGFDQASGEPATQEFELTEKQLEGEPVPLRFVKFQAVHAVTIFIENNQEEEETTKLAKLQFMGVSGEKMNVSEIKKVEDGP
mmetsp:Transcript_8990/g.25838  ORF Transcript_8990/g.25838 Transcript_8990/m.25838 type:complete len:173 (+) Transcript_8990:281-799(+)|eukprot:CAMPEP_0117676624 /NCGR_PEP_ID=MMETSP0804-20121206/16283_1 /TAXON_ID=1074897 /ORGANISM="Tetraselmis astigmatica, Strain CCMP880" /LENGTH=172 /DNA_ID=CAMNT_0005485797 /DNA_START=202 /DNA_END=720 /DNA_ORIENTATION=+